MTRVTRLLRFGLSLSLFLIVLGANWATSERYGSDLPDMDQWDAEGVHLIAPWFQHDHFIQHLFQPQNEHRVILTKLQNLAVVLGANQWDSRVECLFNAVLHAFIAVGLWCLARRWLARRWHAAAYVIIAALYALPLAWQNLLGGFHSQQYWLVGLSFGAMVLLPWATPRSGRWWLGLVAAVLAMGSMGSGFFAAAIVFGIVILRLVAREIGWRDAWANLLLTTILIIVGVKTRVVVDYHDSLKAKSAHDFLLYMLRSLEWPLAGHDWAGVILWAPWLIVTALALRQLMARRSAGPDVAPATRQQHGTWVIFALGSWVWLQLLATAYARGANADYPASRYMDTLIFGSAVNAIALGWLFSARNEAQDSTRPQRRQLATAALGVVSVAWLIALGAGLNTLTQRNVRGDLPSVRNYYAGCEAHVRGYLATGNEAELVDPVPYLNAPWLLQRFALAPLKEHMPSSVRPALPLAPAKPLETPFLENHATELLLDSAPRQGLSPATPALASRPTWGSFGQEGLATTGEWRSAPLTAPLHGWLRIETAGDVGQPGIDLQLRDAATGAVLADIRPTKLPADSWRTAYVRAPKGPFVIVAVDRSPTAWVAFAAPVEMSNLSYWAWQLMKNGLLITEIAAVAAVALGLACAVSGRVSPATRSSRLQELATES
jgi:hypothetical protein